MPNNLVPPDGEAMPEVPTRELTPLEATLRDLSDRTAHLRHRLVFVEKILADLDHDLAHLRVRVATYKHAAEAIDGAPAPAPACRFVEQAPSAEQQFHAALAVRDRVVDAHAKPEGDA